MICGCGTKLIRLSVTLVSAQLTQSQHDFAVIHIQASNGHGAFIQITQAKCMQAQYFDFVRRCSVRTPVFLLVAQRSISFFFFGFFLLRGRVSLHGHYKRVVWFSDHFVVIPNSWDAREMHLDVRNRYKWHTQWITIYLMQHALFGTRLSRLKLNTMATTADGDKLSRNWNDVADVACATQR